MKFIALTFFANIVLLKGGAARITKLEDVITYNNCKLMWIFRSVNNMRIELQNME